MSAQPATKAEEDDSFSKDPAAGDKSTGKGSAAENLSHSESEAPISGAPGKPPGLERIYADRARFVWLSLQRLGIARADLDDVCHDVFIVIQARLVEFEQGARLSPWIFGICAKVAANYRRRAYRRYELAGGSMSEDQAQLPAPASSTPERIVESRQAMQTAEAILQRLGPVKRAVFVMFELEGMPCTEIAAELELPVGTVYSRLHAARQLFAEHAARALAKPRRSS